MTNAESAKAWLTDYYEKKGVKTDGMVAKHFIALSTNTQKVGLRVDEGGGTCCVRGQCMGDQRTPLDTWEAGKRFGGGGRLSPQKEGGGGAQKGLRRRSRCITTVN